LGSASLRQLAAAIGTSDRMLLYYFPDKASLVTSILERVGKRLAGLLEDEVSADRALPPEEMLRVLWITLRKPTFRPYMRLWLELAGYAARDEEPHRAIGAAIAHGFLDWIAARLAVAARDSAATASSVLVQIEGMLLLDAFGVGVGPAHKGR
jgi:AcrR family transcriptional regulator